jgi:hypothetical protein
LSKRGSDLSILARLAWRILLSTSMSAKAKTMLEEIGETKLKLLEDLKKIENKILKISCSNIVKQNEKLKEQFKTSCKH